MPLTLSLDSACGAGSVAIFRDNELLAFEENLEKGTQAKNLVPMIEGALKKAGVWYEDLSQIVCTVGPGSFTGIRIALSVARGLGLVTGLPVHGVSTLACLAYGNISSPHKGKRVLLAILPAGRGGCYAQRFQASTLTPFADAALAPIDRLHTMIDKHTTVITHRDRPIEGIAIPIDATASVDAKAAGAVALHYPALRLPSEPLYIRPPDATLPRQKIAPLQN